ncbi:hypothetical protein Slin15195_G106290 [Septoria linicola]|uniref:Uncharacterized protein n=1 Tax=Septoria linicola TaxID=215465 RepID=A0A9Q9B344_9PEZI|nr:hypothetical protein Slin15195_G106290 [Septoria linicola]
MTLELIIIASPGEIEINREYKPPVQLQINRFTRETCAWEYYCNSIFSGVSAYDQKLFARWLRNLPSKHRGLVSRIEVTHTEIEPDDVPNRRKTAAQKRLDQLHRTRQQLYSHVYTRFAQRP